jgi:hypothetical protein
MDGPRLLDLFPAGVLEEFLKTSYSWPSVRQGVIAIALKGIWGAARIGKPVLAAYKRLYAAAASELTLIDSGSSLAAIGMRHSKLAFEVRKALASGPDIEPGSAVDKLVGPYAKAVSMLCDEALSDPDMYIGGQRVLGSHLVVRLTKDLPAGSPYRFDRPEDVPEDLAMSTAVNVNFSYVETPKVLEHMLICLPWVARAPPERLYLPADFLRAIHVPWTEELALRMLRAHRDQYPYARVQKQEGPSRKGPCPCGSGKKYKRCCAAEETE